MRPVRPNMDELRDQAFDADWGLLTLSDAPVFIYPPEHATLER